MLNIYMYVCMYVCIYVSMYVCMYVHMLCMFVSWGVLLYTCIDYTCRCTGYGFQAFLSRTGYRKHNALAAGQKVKRGVG